MWNGLFLIHTWTGSEILDAELKSKNVE
jgi:hypothetical protein